jgi:hypothetical protein
MPYTCAQAESLVDTPRLYLPTYLTPWGGVLLEKLIVTHQVKKFLAFYGTGMFITIFTRTLSPPWVIWTPFTNFHPISLRSNLILVYHLRLGPPSGSFPSDFSIKTLYVFLVSPSRPTSPVHLILLDFIPLIFCEAYSFEGHHYVVFSSFLPLPSILGSIILSTQFLRRLFKFLNTCLHLYQVRKPNRQNKIT